MPHRQTSVALGGTFDNNRYTSFVGIGDSGTDDFAPSDIQVDDEIAGSLMPYAKWLGWRSDA